MAIIHISKFFMYLYSNKCSLSQKCADFISDNKDMITRYERRYDKKKHVWMKVSIWILTIHIYIYFFFFFFFFMYLIIKFHI